MLTLAFIRHGHHENDQVTDDGFRAVDALADTLGPLLVGKVGIIASPAGRTRQTTNRLKRRFGLTEDIPTFPVLWADDRHPTNIALAAKTVAQAQNGLDSLLVATHLDYAQHFPVVFGAHYGHPPSSQAASWSSRPRPSSYASTRRKPFCSARAHQP